MIAQQVVLLVVVGLCQLRVVKRVLGVAEKNDSLELVFVVQWGVVKLNLRDVEHIERLWHRLFLVLCEALQLD